MVRICVCLVAGLALSLVSGCRLISDAPLLDHAEGKAVYGPEVLLVAEDGDGLVALGKDGMPTMTGFRLRGSGTYVSEGEHAATLSFHRLDDRDGYWLAQFEADGTVVYGVARPAKEKLWVRSVSLPAKRREALAALGYAVKADGSDTRVSDRASLMAAVEAFFRSETFAKPGASDTTLTYRAATDEAGGMAVMGDALAAACLAAAGHPYDPALAQVTAEFRTGRWMGEIDAAKDGAVCAAASELPDASQAVRYARARTLHVAKDYAAAMAIAQDLRREAYPLSYVYIADALINGYGVEVDRVGARRILDDGSRFPVVRHMLGLSLKAGWLGGAPDAAGAAEVLRSAAEDGFAPAEVEYGKMLAAGEGVGKDPVAAFRYFEAAAKAGVGAGSLEAGRALYFGTGVKQDLAAAYEHFEAAVKHRIPEAYYMAGFMKMHGQGTPKDAKKAVGWLEEASTRGIVAATGELGQAVRKGTGVKADPVRGRKLLEEAAAQGDSNARRYLEQTEDPLAGVTGVPADQKDDLRRLAEGKPFEMTETNMPFMAGLATGIMDQCGHPSSIADRTELAAFVATTSTGLMFGNDYSNPDLGKGIGSMARHTALQAAGESVGRKLPCGSLTQQIGSGLIKAVRSNGRSADGGQSRFVSSCQRQFTQTQCTCLANTARAAIPDVHRRTYQRSIIKEMIQRNPLLGFQVGMVCGIVNY